MKKAFYLPVGIFIITSIFWCGAIFGSTMIFRPVLAQTKENDSTLKRWEYCNLVPYNGFSNHAADSSTGTVLIYYARDGESTPEKVKGVVKNYSIDSVIEKAVAKLGNEGWEMIGEGTLSGAQKTLYFKRQIK